MAELKGSEYYTGREQASFKHKLLKAYLERLFMIVGPHTRNICYVDCFAGPWQAKSEELEDTSIAISLNIIKRCREGLKKRAIDVNFKALFIEKDSKAFEKLETFLGERRGDGIETKPLHGEFFALRQEILDWCGNGSFTFFFIDPTGWKESVEPLKTLKPLLQRPNSEFLINFMYAFLLRIHTQKMFEPHVIEIFGEIPQTDHMTPGEKEAYLVNLYRKNLKNVVPAGGGKPRTAYVQVLKPLKDRTLYHLVYLTRHPKGITEFMEASEKLDIVQKINRETAKQQHRIEKSGQGEMFAADEDMLETRLHSDLSEVKTFWLKKLSFTPRYFGVEEFADMLEETGWFMKDFQKAFGELVKDGKARNIDDEKGKRRSQFVHYERNSGKGERLVKIEK
jgi:three-Cys-motif partner protein